MSSVPISVTVWDLIRCRPAKGQLIPEERTVHCAQKVAKGEADMGVFYVLFTIMFQFFHTFTSGSGLGFLVAV